MVVTLEYIIEAVMKRMHDCALIWSPDAATVDVHTAQCKQLEMMNKTGAWLLFRMSVDLLH